MIDLLVSRDTVIDTGSVYEFAAKRVGSTRCKVAVGVVVVAVFLLIWAELAVGVFETPFSGL